MKKKLERDYIIDTLRGLMLVIMTLDHVPLFTKRFTFSPIGFFGAAMGFVFLSSYVFGLVYSKYIDAPKVLIQNTYKRIFLIYKYHIIIFFSLLLMSVASIHFFNINILNPEHHKVIESPKNFIMFLLLLKQPMLFGILPLYIFLLLFSPFILLGFKNGYIKPILFASFLMWLLFQFTITQNLYNDLLNSMSIKLSPFIFFTWQFLFVIGLYLGFNKHKGIQTVNYTKGKVKIALFLIVTIFLIRQFGQSLEWEIVTDLIHIRNTVSFPRLVSFFLVVYLMGWVSAKTNLKKSNYLSFIGRYSLDVFVFHLFITFFCIKAGKIIYGLPKIVQLFLAVFIAISLCIPAIIKSESKKDKEKRKERILKNVNYIFLIPKDLTNLLKFSIKKISNI